jgi:OOP family OmpA-OmpF porin
MSIVFDSGSDLLSTGATMIISGIPMHGASKILVVGHTDTMGTLRENQILSERRAETVAEYLHNGFGIPHHQIRDSGVNYSQPRVATLSQVACQENRRVEITVVP